MSNVILCVSVEEAKALVRAINSASNKPEIYRVVSDLKPRIVQAIAAAEGQNAETESKLTTLRYIYIEDLGSDTLQATARANAHYGNAVGEAIITSAKHKKPVSLRFNNVTRQYEGIENVPDAVEEMRVLLGI